MTRKRFVKLLMAAEYSRNGANAIAEGVRKSGMTYAEVFAIVPRLHPNIQRIASRVTEAFRAVSDVIVKMASTILAAMNRT